MPCYLFVVRRICFRLPRTFDWSIFLRRWENFVAGFRLGFGLFCDILLWFQWVCDTVSIVEVNARYQHSTLNLRIVLIAVLACALAGCWEEIHYSPPPATSDVAQPAPLPTESPTGTFADEVATSLAAGETASAVGELSENETEVPTEDVASTDTTDTRYAPTPPESEPITLPPEPNTEPTSEQPVTAPETTAPAPPNPARSSRRIAWALGSNLSLAALGNDRALSADRIADWFGKSQRLAALVNTKVVDLPPRPAANAIDPTAARAMEYLFDQGQAIGSHLATQNGDDHAALFELALKSNILLVRYEPQAPVVKALAAAISQAAERAKLPPELYQPLLTLLAENAPAKDVRNAVFDMHANVDRFLSTAQP
jgi:hypothetical protein